MKMLQENNGKYSAKRVMGATILFSLLILFIYKEVVNEVILNMEVFISHLITAGTLLGITIIKPKENGDIRNV
jgi:hypothetical protein